MATYLITGGCGFIGSHLTRHLLQQGHHVRVIDSLEQIYSQSLPSQVDFIRGDCRSQLLLDEYLQGVAGVFHLAAAPYPVDDPAGWLLAQQMNLGTTVALLEALRRHADQSIDLVYASSAEVYGDNASYPLQELATPCPQSAYGTDKLCSELQIRSASRQFGLSSIILRLFNVYGPSHNPMHHNQDAISRFVHSLLAGTPLVIEGDGEQTRDFLYIEDAVRMLCAALPQASSQAPVVNACSGVSHSVNQLLVQLLSVSDCLAEVSHEAAPIGQIRQSLGDPRKASQLLGVQVSTELQQGLRQTYWHYAALAQPGKDQQWA